MNQLPKFAASVSYDPKRDARVLRLRLMGCALNLSSVEVIAEDYLKAANYDKLSAVSKGMVNALIGDKNFKKALAAALHDALVDLIDDEVNNTKE